MDSKKIGITGHNGFLGYHLKNGIKYHFPNYEIVDFKRDFFQKPALMSAFINSCDVIIHLAGLNRHNSSEEIARTNIQLAKTIAKSLIKNNYKGSLIYSSSLQEYKETPYGSSKKQAGDILTKAASTSGFSYTTLILPNIFGPFGKPNYNSFIATFSHELIHGKGSKIIKDDKIPLIYVESVVNHILKCIDSKGILKKRIPYETEKKVSEVLEQLKRFHHNYFEKGNIPKLENTFDIQLFNTFRCTVDHSKHFPKRYKLHIDERGYFSELIRSYSKGQQSYSVTKSGVTRGNHFHTRKIERFSVIQGEALIQMRRVGFEERIEFELNGENPSYVDIPVWTTHNITNIGKEDLITIFWINEYFDPEDADVYFEKV
jgi:UDP-2-acetamido-2,6-beta-L-arabino-hexul-4-ose reductase